MNYTIPSPLANFFCEGLWWREGEGRGRKGKGKGNNDLKLHFLE
jgi:hypothetical protein